MQNYLKTSSFFSMIYFSFLVVRVNRFGCAIRYFSIKTNNTKITLERQHASCGVITMQDNRRGLLVVGGWQSNLARK